MKNDKTVTVTGRYIGGALFSPKQAVEGAPLKYSACVILDEGQDEIVQAAIDAAKLEMWGEKPPGKLEDWGVREGDDSDFTESYGHKFINAKSSKPIQTLYKVDGVMHTADEESGIIYRGCYVAVSVNSYAYKGAPEKSIRPGVSLNARAVMFLKHGEKLGDVVDANEFEGFDSEDSIADAAIPF